MVDITTPDSPVIVGSVDTPGFAVGVAVSGSYAYVANHASGLQVVDITTPGSPVIVGTVDTPGFALDVAISGSYAYVADHNSGLMVVDITTPGSPVVVGSVDTPGFAYGVALSGNYIYVADASRLQVVDITTPGSPVIVGSVDTPGVASGVAVSGSYAYVADFNSGLVVVDITTPATPVIVGSVETPDFAHGVALSGNYAYVAAEASGLQVVDITTPGSPVIVGSVDTPEYAYGVAVSGSYAYVAEGVSGLQVLPAQCETIVPVLITSFEASTRDGNVVIQWDVWSDEGLERFTLYRSDDASAPAVVIAQGRFDPTTRSYVDATVEPGKTYRYELVIHTQDGEYIRSPVTAVTVPRFKTALGRSFPNPFNAKASIDYTLGKRSRAVVGIYDAAGRLVARLDQGTRNAGTHRVEWDGRDSSGNVVGGGVYFYRLEGARGVALKKMVRSQ